MREQLEAFGCAVTFRVDEGGRHWLYLGTVATAFAFDASFAPLRDGVSASAANTRPSTPPSTS